MIYGLINNNIDYTRVKIDIYNNSVIDVID